MNSSQLSREKIPTSSPNISSIGDLVMDAMEVGHWWSNRQLQIWLRGYATLRYTTLEEILKKKSFRNKVRVATYSGRKQGTINVYALKKKTRGFSPDNKTPVFHGLSCTECLLRFYRSDPKGEILPERFFRKSGSVPEWGIRYENGTMLMLEFGTRSNVEYHNLISGKLNAYKRNLKGIEEKFSAKGVVLFVLDVPRATILRRLKEWEPKGPYRFVDFQTFLSVPFGKALDAEIYIYPDGSVGGL